MEKNGTYSGDVSGYGTAGEGIINVEGTTCFVPFCIRGERVSFKTLKIKGAIAYGKLEKVLAASPDRVSAPCPVFGKCGGCELQHMSYAAQLSFKRESVKAALAKIGNIDAEVDETVPCEKPFNYRNKLVLPVGADGAGRTVVGFYAPHSHRIVPADGCLIQSEWAGAVYAAVRKFCAESGLSGYDEERKKGVIRRIVAREIKGRYIFALVATKVIDATKLIRELEKSFDDFTFALNVNAGDGNAVFGKEWHICRGEGVISAEEGGIKYSAGANTFLQVNDDVRAKLYERVLSLLDERDVAIDLYSGGGMLTAMLAKKCGAAYGIEISKEASRCADDLAAKNGLQDKMHNVCGAVENEIARVLAAAGDGKKTVVCDPPRKGMERSVVYALAKSGADRIALISCNPATLARDLGLLTGTLSERDGGIFKAESPVSDYKIDSVTPFDMFPQTKWCETLVVLSRK